MDDLTNFQKKVLTLLYKEMLCRMDTLPPDKANFFINSNYVRDLIISDVSNEYIAEQCWKLKSRGYINCSPGDNLANNIEIEDKTIIYFENSFNRNMSAITNFLLKLK